jgi:hypothetical protein
MSGACSTCLGETRLIKVGKYKGKRPLGRPRHGWEDSIKIDIKYDGGCAVD